MYDGRGGRLKSFQDVKLGRIVLVLVCEHILQAISLRFARLFFPLRMILLVIYGIPYAGIVVDQKHNTCTGDNRYDGINPLTSTGSFPRRSALANVDISGFCQLTMPFGSEEK